MLRISWGKSVFDVFRLGGISQSLCAGLVRGVNKTFSFYKLLHGFMTSLFHDAAGSFISVVAGFIPIFHTPNNKRLSNLYLVINCRRFV